MGLLSMLFGGGTDKNAMREAIKNGAIIIDVRTAGEFSQGHAKGSKNIPLDKIADKTGEIIKWNKPVVVCCASGMRSAQAASILKKAGLANVYNAGGWTSLR